MLKNGFRKYRILEALKGDDVGKALQDLFQVLIRRIPAIPSHWYKRSVCVLLFRSTLSLVDISCVESKHATIRRVLEASSVQTWRASLAKALCRVHRPPDLFSKKRAHEDCRADFHYQEEAWSQA